MVSINGWHSFKEEEDEEPDDVEESDVEFSPIDAFASRSIVFMSRRKIPELVISLKNGGFNFSIFDPPPPPKAVSSHEIFRKFLFFETL